MTITITILTSALDAFTCDECETPVAVGDVAIYACGARYCGHLGCLEASQPGSAAILNAEREAGEAAVLAA